LRTAAFSGLKPYGLVDV